MMNISVSYVLKNRSSEKIWIGETVDLTDLKIFGSPIRVHIPKQKQAKRDPKSRKMLYVGYSNGTKGYRCIDPNGKRFAISRNVVFMEQNYESGSNIAENLDLVRYQEREHTDLNKNERSGYLESTGATESGADSYHSIKEDKVNPEDTERY
ncbi:hypothetical protein Trydic_g3933 [Trypoxylus dichotomus]